MTIYQKCIGIINDTCLPEPSFLIENVFFGFISVVCGMGIASAFVSHLIKYTKDVENDDDSDENGDVESTDEYDGRRFNFFHNYRRKPHGNW